MPEVTDLMVAARRDRRRVPAPDQAPSGRPEAFKAQIATLDALGLDIAGFKVGAAGRTGEPSAAPLAAGTVFTGEAAFTVSEARPLWLEAELGFRIGSDIAAGPKGVDADAVLAAVEGPVAAIEVVDPRLSDWPDVPPLLALADFQANGATVVSAVGRGIEGLRVEDLEVTFEMGAVSRRVPGREYPGEDAERLVTWLAGNLGLWGDRIRARGLRRGDVIITGSWIGVVPAEPGVTARVAIPGVGSVSVAIRAGD